MSSCRRPAKPSRGASAGAGARSRAAAGGAGSPSSYTRPPAASTKPPASAPAPASARARRRAGPRARRRATRCGRRAARGTGRRRRATTPRARAAAGSRPRQRADGAPRSLGRAAREARRRRGELRPERARVLVGARGVRARAVAHVPILDPSDHSAASGARPRRAREGSGALRTATMRGAPRRCGRAGCHAAHGSSSRRVARQDTILAGAPKPRSSTVRERSAFKVGNDQAREARGARRGRRPHALQTTRSSVARARGRCSAWAMPRRRSRRRSRGVAAALFPTTTLRTKARSTRSRACSTPTRSRASGGRRRTAAAAARADERGQAREAERGTRRLRRAAG